MQKVTFKCTPLSVNAAWQGRRYKTNDYKAYEQEIWALVPPELRDSAFEGLLEVTYRFHLKYHAITDYDNLIKPLQDILQKCGVIEDDRFIYKANIEKIPADEDMIEVEIQEYEK